jgi:Pyruvate/2-oxoacid:ferredoxin oxidoreductase delta subunit
MCEFCDKHGEGKKWYLQAKNYSQDLYSDLAKHQVFDIKKFSQDTKRLGELKKAPALVRAVMTPYITERIKRMHYGQVLPIEDVEQIFGMVNRVVRLACICRKKRNVTEQRFCYGVSIVPQGEEAQKVINQPGSGFSDGPDTRQLETVSKEQALENFRLYEKEGLCHTVWTKLTPFIAGICNCDRADCGALQHTVVDGVQTMFKAEYVAEINPELCSGCRQCMRACQFGAIGYSAGSQRAYIDQNHCYGCGVCRASCVKDAIHLRDRASVPAVANLW